MSMLWAAKQAGEDELMLQLEEVTGGPRTPLPITIIALLSTESILRRSMCYWCSSSDDRGHSTFNFELTEIALMRFVDQPVEINVFPSVLRDFPEHVGYRKLRLATSFNRDDTVTNGDSCFI